MEQRTADVTLFDLDGVLMTRDTMATLIVQRLRRRPLRVLAVLPVYAVAVIAGSHREVAAKANRLAVRITFAGLDESGYRAMAVAAGRHMAQRPDLIRKDLMRLCRDAQGSSRVVVVTASEHHLVEALLTACGLPDVELVASHLAFSSRGPRVVLHNVGAEKVRSLHAAGVSVSEATFYTDSASDLPLALVAARTVIVHPGKRSRRRLLAALPNTQIIE